MTKYYVYVQCRPSGEPFNVGKGHGRRAYDFKNARNKYFKNIIEKYGAACITVYVRACETEQQAFQHEMWMIAWCRAQGHRVCNMTDGGEGMSGSNHWLGKKHSKETRLRMSTSASGKVFSEAHRRNIGAASKGRQHTEATRTRISATLKARGPQEYHRSFLGKKHTQETLDKMAASARLRWAAIAATERTRILSFATAARLERKRA